MKAKTLFNVDDTYIQVTMGDYALASQKSRVLGTYDQH